MCCHYAADFSATPSRKTSGRKPVHSKSIMPIWPVTTLAYRTWLDIRTARSPRLLSDTRRATMLYHDHEGSPPPGFGTDPAELEAMLHWGAGRYEALMDAAARAEARAVKRGDTASLASALWLGAVARDRLAPVVWEPDGVRHGQYIPANAIAESALREAADQLVRADGLIEDGEHWFTATVHIERAVNAKALGATTAAIASGQKAVELRRALRDQRGMVDALIRLGDSYLDFEQPDAARAVLAEAQGFVHRLGDINTLTEYERAMGFMYFAEGHFDRALEMFDSAVSTSQQAGSANNVLSSLQGIGEILSIRGQAEFADEIQAFVLAHPATTSFSKARALFALESAGRGTAALPGPSVRFSEFAVHVVSSLETKRMGLGLPRREP